MTETELSLLTNNNIKLLETYKGAKQHHNMKCLTCNHIWSATPISKTQTFKKNKVSGCPACNERNKQEKYNSIREDTFRTFADLGIEILTPDYNGARVYKDHQVVKFRNTHCGHEFESLPGNILSRDVTCAVCGSARRAEHNKERSRIASERFHATASPWISYKHKARELSDKTYRQYKNEINPNNYHRTLAKRDMTGYQLDYIVPIRFCYDNSIPVEVCSHKDNLRMIPWQQNISKKTKITDAIPTIFHRYIKVGTRHQQIQYKFNIELGESKNISIEQHQSYFCNGEIAVFVLPIDNIIRRKYKIADTLYKECIGRNIKPIIIFEDEWVSNENLIISKLKHQLKLSQTEVIYARRLELRLIDATLCNDFLDKHHTQGKDTAHIRIGGFFQDRLVAVMTFAKPRVALGQKSPKDNYWELSRFATDVNYRIPGCASRLLSHFKKNWEWEQIYSYADKRWSDGNLYYQLGFSLAANNPPQYFYNVDGKRKHRWGFRKDVLKDLLPNYDPTLTEEANMELAGYYRIWDCGTLKFVMEKSQKKQRK